MGAGVPGMSIEPGQSVQGLIDARPISAYQLGTIALVFAVILVDGYDLLVMATAVPAIAAQWSLPAASFGLALSAVSIGLAAGAMCTAPLADHVGRRPIILIGLLAVGLTSMATASSRSLTELFIWRLLTGAGLGTCFSSAFALLVDLTPRRRKALFAALHGCNTSPRSLARRVCRP
jgi:MFS transporter, AAHS family, 4-hydroxybenzoate transporter